MAMFEPGKSARSQRMRWFAPRCAVCALGPGSPLCDGCERDFFPAATVRCAICALRLVAPAAVRCGVCLREPPHFDATTSLADYVARVTGMVSALKFGGRLDLADTFARLLAARESARADLVLAVPLSFERGFNQSLEIACRYSRLTGAQLAEHNLLKARDVVPQQSLARDARLRNVRGAFRANGEVRSKRVAVIDDVMTTGSTLNEIAEC